MRINARLDESRARKLSYLREHTGHRISDLIKEAIDIYYDRIRAKPTLPEEILNDVGFIACGEDEPDLSAGYKQRLTESLFAKHGDR